MKIRGFMGSFFLVYLFIYFLKVSMISRLQEAERQFRAIVPTPCPPVLHAGGCSLSLPQKILSGNFQRGVRVQDRKKKKTFPFIESCVLKTNTVIYQSSE